MSLARSVLQYPTESTANGIEQIKFAVLSAGVLKCSTIIIGVFSSCGCDKSPFTFSRSSCSYISCSLIVEVVLGAVLIAVCVVVAAVF